MNHFFSAMKDTWICGVFIPKNTTVIANFWAVNNDENIWEKPREFNPNRFLTGDGKVIENEAFIPFSTG